MYIQRVQQNTSVIVQRAVHVKMITPRLTGRPAGLDELMPPRGQESKSPSPAISRRPRQKGLAHDPSKYQAGATIMERGVITHSHAPSHRHRLEGSKITAPWHHSKHSHTTTTLQQSESQRSQERADASRKHARKAKATTTTTTKTYTKEQTCSKALSPTVSRHC